MNPSEYDLEFFRENGFVRRQCPSCGRYFWSLGDWETCGEPPCDEYAFIGDSPMERPMDIHEVREAYLSFFEENGHTRIGRYPIVARWRNDVFFTQASIYDFQPYVIDRVIEPPANPLTISQTCVRFNDIDNVGKTGRHFTFFEMLAHHAFNWEGNEIYFKNRTTELCHRLFVERFGTDPKRLRYIEEWWEGGGNSGPCLEVMLEGVEVSTLVFMQYVETPEGRRPLDMRVVDTGYGLERIAWVSQGTPSAYEAVFGPVIESLKAMVDVEADPRVLVEYSKVAGATDMKTAADLRRIREETASRIGIEYDELMETVGPLEHIYAVCDHSRALAFMLNDAVVPSNVREGYFARLLIRRALRSIRSLGLEITLADVVAQQIDFFSPQFPEMEENREDILCLVKVEEGRYHDTLDRGRQLVSRLTKGMGEDDVVDLETLIELYDSHGLNPEIVQEFSDARVEIPDDFFMQVAIRHEAPEVEGACGTVMNKGLPDTEALYYEDPTIGEFDATVIAIEDGAVVLDRTAFYPEGGGQECDLGEIDGKGVTDVIKSRNTILHRIDGEAPGVGERVHCTIDMGRRRQLMSHHSAAHVINGVCRRMFGNHIWQSGAHKSVDAARLDVTHFENLSKEQIAHLEMEANRVVMEDIEVRTRVRPRDEAEAEFGFRLYQGGVVPGKMIRVVEIPGLDAEACGGVHVTRTSHIGPIRIERTRRIQDGVVRIEYTAGMAAVRNMQADRCAIDELSSSLNAPRESVVDSVGRLQRDGRECTKEFERLTKRYNDLVSDDLMGDAREVGGVKVITHMLQEGEDPSEVSKRLSSEEGVLAVIGVPQTKARVLVSRGAGVTVDCREMLDRVMGIIGGGGGGKPDYAQGGGGDPSKLKGALESVPDILEDMLA